MDRPTSMRGVDLHGALTVLPGGATGLPLPLREGRIGPAPRRGAARIDLGGATIVPGLVNAHDHLHVNAIPPLARGEPFASSYEWIEAFKLHFGDPAVAAALAVSKRVRLYHGALKNLLAGTTCVAHHDPWDTDFGAPDFPVSVLRDQGWSYALGWPGYGPDPRQSFSETPCGHPWIIHLAEGTDAASRAELARLEALECLASNTVLVHGVGLSAHDIERVIARGAAVVWCPSSNRALLGATLDPQRLLAAGRLALGTDSRLSGARDLLEEMRGILADGVLDPMQLLELATTAAARILRLSDRGALLPGHRADLLVVADDRGTGAGALAGTRRSELRAVVRDGMPCITDPDLGDWFGLAGVDAVPVTLDGRPKLLASWLADPEVLALEPGLALVEEMRQPACATGSG
ncbi:amidohydrolase family protein [Luteimonas sp. 8-5]|uniref:amidohydrolase family protein n=1 Tax=Luteimonas sp. 8-5 TaxID=3039387 RepID=UPI00243729EB|nr:amidohydrolase family protein [Luteimonas sp. 8-5]MDG6349397.1 amidohydrolase family protein [Luteimonas sp. 8-5]